MYTAINTFTDSCVNVILQKFTRDWTRVKHNEFSLTVALTKDEDQSTVSIGVPLPSYDNVCKIKKGPRWGIYSIIGSIYGPVYWSTFVRIENFRSAFLLEVTSHCCKVFNYYLKSYCCYLMVPCPKRCEQHNAGPYTGGFAPVRTNPLFPAALVNSFSLEVFFQLCENRQY